MSGRTRLPCAATVCTAYTHAERIKAWLLLLCAGAIICGGCTLRRSGYAADEAIPPIGSTYRDVIERLGNPTSVKTQSSGTEAVWMGSITEGGSCKISFWGVGIDIGKTHTEIWGRRFLFNHEGHLVSSSPIGSDEATWGILPFN